MFEAFWFLLCCLLALIFFQFVALEKDWAGAVEPFQRAERVSSGFGSCPVACQGNLGLCILTQRFLPFEKINNNSLFFEIQSAKSTPCVTGPEKPNIWTQRLVVTIFLPGAALSWRVGGRRGRWHRAGSEAGAGAHGPARPGPAGRGAAGRDDPQPSWHRWERPGQPLHPPERENL